MTLEESLMNVAFLQAEKDIDTAFLKLFQGASSLASQLLISTNPVRTGNSRGNWRASRNRRFPKPKNPEKLLVPASPTAESLGRGEKSHEKNLKTIKKSVVGDVLFITNHTPYVGYLNDGLANPAYAGFVQKVELKVKAYSDRRFDSIVVR
jgi:hypothetical protein